jgi:cob(I)alamin adenosyltransferase
MRIYTRAGDGGETGILRGPRLSKSHARIRALGGLDELNAGLGLVLAEGDLAPALRPCLEKIQATLMEVGAALATPDLGTGAELFVEETRWLEGEVDRLEAGLPALRQFILPGGCRSGAGLHWCRTLARRAESGVVLALEELPPAGAKPALLAYLNRLSDALFVFARTANQAEGAAESRWTSRQKPGDRGKEGRSEGGS